MWNCRKTLAKVLEGPQVLRREILRELHANAHSNFNVHLPVGERWASPPAACKSQTMATHPKWRACHVASFCLNKSTGTRCVRAASKGRHGVTIYNDNFVAKYRSCSVTVVILKPLQTSLLCVALCWWEVKCFFHEIVCERAPVLLYTTPSTVVLTYRTGVVLQP